MRFFFIKGLSFALYQPDDSPASLAAMKREDLGGICEFELTYQTCGCYRARLSTVGNEVHFSFASGESLATSWELPESDTSGRDLSL
jgi:hypothetical protein